MQALQKASTDGVHHVPERGCYVSFPRGEPPSIHFCFEGPEANPLTGHSRRRVVIVDDVKGLRHLLRIALALNPRNVVVGEADNGRSAIELVERLTPDIVLLDLAMPVMDGLEALPRILDAHPTCRVVVLSGFIEDRMAPMALALGAAGYLEKGLTPEELLARLDAIIDGEDDHHDETRRSTARAAPSKTPEGD